MMRKRFFGQLRETGDVTGNGDDGNGEEAEEVNFHTYDNGYRSKPDRGNQQAVYSSSSREEEELWRHKMRELREAKETARLKMEQSKQGQGQEMNNGDGNGVEKKSHRHQPSRNGSIYLDAGNGAHGNDHNGDEGAIQVHRIDRGRNDNVNRDTEHSRHRIVDWRDFIPVDTVGRTKMIDDVSHGHGGNNIQIHAANLEKLLKAYLSNATSNGGDGMSNQFESSSLRAQSRHTMVMQPSMAELFEKISIDPMICKLLKLNLGELTKNISENSANSKAVAASSKVRLEKLPLRFMHEEHYIELFQPLLLEEFKAAAISHLTSLQSHANRDASFKSRGKGASSGQVMKGRCILATPRVGCAKLTEVHMQSQFNDGGSSRDADGTMLGRSYQSNILFTDELVLVFSKPLPDGEMRI